VSVVRLGVIGLGNMGFSHLGYLPGLSNVKVTAVCDLESAKIDRGLKRLADKGIEAKGFEKSDDLIKSGLCDTILVATPHYDHPPIGIAALQAGHHLLVEKPIAVGVRAAQQLIAEAKKHPKQVFGIMYNQRSNPMFAKLRELIAAGELGKIYRVTWLITDWFRTHAYYASGGWRATWSGEGGGVLINQCPHNLDLIQWITGLMPSRVTAVGYLGKRHPIEVEDEMSAILEYDNGAIGHFVTTTGEAPGTNRLEIAGERGKIIAENGKLIWSRTVKNVTEVNESSPDAFASVETWQIDVPYKSAPAAWGEHERVMRNFISAIVDGTPLLAPGSEGARGLEIGNAMLMSAMQKRGVDLPIDGAAFDQLVLDLAKQYGGRKTLTTREVKVDMEASSNSFR
jgi:predicted dehydrogenase